MLARLPVRLRASCDGGMDHPLAGAEADPERYEEAAQDHRGGADQPALGSEGTAGPQGGAALIRAQEGSPHGPQAADGEAEDATLEEVPRGVQADGDGQLAGQHVAEAEHQARQGDVEGAGEGGVRVAGVEVAEEGRGENPRQEHRVPGSYEG